MTGLPPLQTTGRGEQSPPVARGGSTTFAPEVESRKSAFRQFLQTALGPLVLLIVWYAAGRLGILNPRLIPPPDAVFASTWTAIVQGTMINDVIQTLGRVVLSFLIAAGIGVPVGIIIGANERIYRSVEFLIDFFRSTPATAMFPLFMLIFGLGDQGKVALAAFSALLIIVFNVAYGVLNARKT